MTYPQEIETERLLLRWPEDADSEEIFARYASDPAVTRYMTWRPHKSVDETREFRRSRVADRDAGRSFNWLIRRRSDCQVLGMIGCSVDKHIVQFGYCFAQDAWGQGYATEAASALVPIWLANPTVWRVQAFCDLENVASARVLEKAGLAREGILRKHAVPGNLGDRPRDVYVYARVREG